MIGKTNAIGKSGIDPALFGCTKYAVDEFTFAADTVIAVNSNLSINHSLGEVPTILFIIANDSISTDNGIIKLMNITVSKAGDKGAVIYYSANGNKVAESPNVQYASDIVTLRGTFAAPHLTFPAGIEYTLITMA